MQEETHVTPTSQSTTVKRDVARIMRSVTSITTIFAIVAGVAAVCNALFIVFVGFFLGLLLTLPHFFTLAMSKRASGVASQSILLASTLFYSAVFVFVFYFHQHVDGKLNFPALLYSLPVMIGLWITAGLISGPPDRT
ncbi:MAG: hypothetical protein ABIT37_04300 [Luteolibacter sp.]